MIFFLIFELLLETLKCTLLVVSVNNSFSIQQSIFERLLLALMALIIINLQL